MNLREAAQMALEALEEHRTVYLNDNDYLGVCAWCRVDSCDPCDEKCTSNNAITALRAALAEDAMQRLTDVQQEMERQDGTGKTSDHIPDATKMVPTINETETVEPVAYVQGYRDGFCVINPVKNVVFPTGMALYRSPSKREPLTESFLEELAEKHVTHCYFDTLTYARAIERLHGIGRKE